MGSWKNGDRTFAQLLLDENAVVWVRTVEVMERSLSGARHSATDWEELREFRRELYRLGPEFSIRFHLLPTIHSYHWRKEYWVPGDAESSDGTWDWRFYWTARAGLSPAATPEAREFILSVIYDWAYEHDVIRHSPTAIRHRAVDGLLAMWVGAKEEKVSLEKDVLDLIHSESAEPEVRLWAATRFMEATYDNFEACSPVKLREWEVMVGNRDIDGNFDDPRMERRSMDSRLVELPMSAYYALTLVEHPRVAEILRRLKEWPVTSEILDQLSRDPRVPEVRGLDEAAAAVGG